MLGKRAAALTWSQLSPLAARWSPTPDPTSGPTSAQSRLRLFGAKESDVRVTLYRDNHAWCPYCQKCWLWLEEKQVPYKIEKITMFCYGEKEAAYKRLVPSGMLPALSIDGDPPCSEPRPATLRLCLGHVLPGRRHSRVYSYFRSDDHRVRPYPHGARARLRTTR